MSTFDYDALAAAGIEKVQIDYNGSNDEGYINDIATEPPVPWLDVTHSLYRDVEQVAYDILETHFPGWEINEGADGTITIDVKARKAVLHHGEIIEHHNWTDIQV